MKCYARLIQLCLVALLILLGSGSYLNATTTAEEKLKLLDKLEMLEKLDKLDHLDFLDAIEAANKCAKARDFTCAKNNIKSAEDLAQNDVDFSDIEFAKNTLKYEEERVQTERRIKRQKKREKARQEELAEKRKKEHKRQARLERKRQQEAESRAASAAWAEGLDRKLENWGRDMQSSVQQFNTDLHNNTQDALRIKRQASQSQREQELEKQNASERRRIQEQERERKRRLEREQERVQENREKAQRRQAEARRMNEIKNKNMIQGLVQQNIQPPKRLSTSNVKNDCSTIASEVATAFDYSSQEPKCYFDDTGKMRARAEIRSCIVALKIEYDSVAKSIYGKYGRLDCMEVKKSKDGLKTISQ